jgi:hypothetical protein
VSVPAAERTIARRGEYPAVPASLRIVGALFLLDGAWSVVGMFRSVLVRGADFDFDLGFLALFVGSGLLRLSRPARMWGLAFIWVAFIALPVGAMLSAWGSPTDLTLFGVRVGQRPDVFGPLWLSGVFLLNYWQYRVLTDPSVKALCGIEQEGSPRGTSSVEPTLAGRMAIALMVFAIVATEATPSKPVLVGWPERRRPEADSLVSILETRLKARPDTLWLAAPRHLGFHFLDAPLDIPGTERSVADWAIRETLAEAMATVAWGDYAARHGIDTITVELARRDRSDRSTSTAYFAFACVGGPVRGGRAECRAAQGSR